MPNNKPPFDPLQKLERRNGVTQPGYRTKTRFVWYAADASMVDLEGVNPPFWYVWNKIANRNDTLAPEHRIPKSTVQTQLSYWRKFHGLQQKPGRPVGSKKGS